ncbi:MAG TPA: hypothetical protein ENJ29_10680 [Bacteroidetes bacterium]|nr:hypothetical protein [Bacteroidota bacterium]
MTLPPIDSEALLRFENQLDPGNPESGAMPARILGYGEISAVLAVAALPDVALKRMPPFPNAASRHQYAQLVDQYCQLLQANSTVLPVPFRIEMVHNARQEFIAYIVQPLLPAENIAHNYLHTCDEPAAEQLILQLMTTLESLWANNREDESSLLMGLDAQLSNWFCQRDENGDLHLHYLDYSTPFLRRHNRELLDIDIFLKSLPGFLTGVVRRFFLQDILDRYYDFRAVLVDIAANLHKEKLQHRIPLVLEIINQRLRENGFGLNEITRTEVEKYYREDAFLWELLLRLRRFDRFMTRTIRRQHYNFILPGKIDR